MFKVGRVWVDGWRDVYWGGKWKRGFRGIGVGCRRYFWIVGRREGRRYLLFYLTVFRIGM